ncbi:MAG TPA: LysM peptidoglycan-binding domain-containing protein [Anaerolineales bacterium]|nr:LysM peptidoglycan-binding domain-containing protein [Anaerolineales bacterium]
MHISHEEARKLIQFNSDNALTVDQKKILHSHVEICTECLEFAKQMGEMESILKPVMQRKWNQPYPPLPTATIIARSASRISDNIVMATRTIAVGAIAIVFMFSVWQFSLPASKSPGTLSVSAPPVPTPSFQLTSTSISKNCVETNYIVQPEDTLDSIAETFSVAKQEILSYNNLKTEVVQSGMELGIQTCSTSPTGTVNTVTTTFTPWNSPTTTTPGG